MFSRDYRSAAALMAAAAMVAVCAACGSTTDSTSSSSASSSATAHIADCVVKGPGPSSVDDAFTDIQGFTVEQICPGDVDPTLAAKATVFLAVNSGKVVADGKPALSVFAGQLKSDGGDAFVRTFLEEMSARVAPKTMAMESKDVHGYAVTHFSVPSDAEGDAYFEGPTVVIAYNLVGAESRDAAEKALGMILTKVFPSS